jgi:2-keto-4-pentenoate hydratase/2-oxohepta-3-ene-1,7-dioic acid hydratase in catechol pathway
MPAVREGYRFESPPLHQEVGANRPRFPVPTSCPVVAFPRGFPIAPLGELPAIYKQIPIYYITNRQTVVGPGVTVRWPRYSTVMDYELEVAAITKRTRVNIPAFEGAEHIFGYTIFNDFSARDRQSLEMQGRLGPAKGKSFDGSNAMRPWIVTADELGDPQTLKVEVRVNGETRSTGSTSGMLFSFAELIADASQDETIQAGEVFGSGTVGNCCGLEIGRFLNGSDESSWSNGGKTTTARPANEFALLPRGGHICCHAEIDRAVDKASGIAPVLASVSFFGVSGAR